MLFRSRIGGITADIHGDGQPSRLTRRVDLCLCEERRNQRREVDAVDEDIDIEDLLEWSTLGCLRQIPFEDIISEIIIKNAIVNLQNPASLTVHERDSLFETDLAKEVYSATSTSSKSTDHEGLDALSAPPEELLDVAHHRRFVRVRFETT